MCCDAEKLPRHGKNHLSSSLADGTWKLRAEPWIALDGPRKRHLEAITLWATRREHTPGLFLENKGQLHGFFHQLLHSEMAMSVLFSLFPKPRNRPPGDSTTSQLRALGFEIHPTNRSGP